MILDNFDFSILESPEFLEDSVREEILTPILHKLGYSASGENRIARSKSLTHPYVYIGTQARKINIIPDYILHVAGKPAIIIDAKAPKENIESGPNVEQAFSYSIHKEVRTFLYALCNGRLLTIFNVSEYEPIAVIDLTQISSNWNEIERLLSPKYYERPYLADFYLDLGLSCKRIGAIKDVQFIFMISTITSIIKMAEDEYTLNCTFQFDEINYLGTFDFGLEHYENLKSILSPKQVAFLNDQIRRQPFQCHFEITDIPEVTIFAKLTEDIIKSTLTSEDFCPFSVTAFVKINET
jgi:hypothetical protein